MSTVAKASAASPFANRLAASMNTVRDGGVAALRGAASAEEATPVGLARERIGRPADDGGGFTRSGGKRGGGGVGLAV
ncbi:hypothetical protein ACWDZ8_43995 [Streptomyces sp. NPDC003233]